MNYVRQHRTAVDLQCRRLPLDGNYSTIYLSQNIMETDTGQVTRYSNGNHVSFDAVFLEYNADLQGVKIL